MTKKCILARLRSATACEVQRATDASPCAAFPDVQARISYADRTNLAVVHTQQLPAARAWLARRLQDTFFPMVADRYGLQAASLRVFDSIIIRYNAIDAAEVRLPVHRDVSLISLNIALSSPTADFDGGGTFFEGLYDELASGATEAAEAAASTAAALALPRGHALCHPSGLRHGAHRITRGERYVMIVFVLDESVAHTARRFSDLAGAYESRGELARAASILCAALEIEPFDHELHYGLANLQAQMGHADAARESLQTSESLYPQCPKPHLLLGSLLLAAGRLRAALRRFERALALVPDPLDEDAMDATLNAGICGVRLAEAHPSRAAALLPAAERRLRAVLETLEGEDRAAIEGMLSRAQAAAESARAAAAAVAA